MKNKRNESSDEDFNALLSRAGKRNPGVKSGPLKFTFTIPTTKNSGSSSVGKRKSGVRSTPQKCLSRKQNRNAGRSRSDISKVPFASGDVGPTENGELMIWDPCYQPEDYWTATVYISSDICALSRIKRNLNETQLSMFRETCFGRFLDLSEIRVQPQSIHCLLMRELYQPDTSCLFIEVGGERLRFGKEEFSMICGLKCLENKVVPNGQGARLIEKYFQKKKQIYCADIAQVFMDKKWDTDEDAVKLSLMYFIHVFLLGTPDNRFIAETDFDLVETGDYSEYSWGTHVFDLTIRSLKKNSQNLKRPSYYRMYGCPVLFQLWFYEVCGFCRGFLCERISSGIPRMFNWRTVNTTFNRENLERNLFSKTPKQLNCKNLVPDEEEIKILELYHMWMVPYEVAPKEEDDSMDENTDSSFDDESDQPSQHIDGSDRRSHRSSGRSERNQVLREVAALRMYTESCFEKVFRMLGEINKNLS